MQCKMAYLVILYHIDFATLLAAMKLWMPAKTEERILDPLEEKIVLSFF